MSITEEYGCCFNSFAVEFSGRRYEMIMLVFLVFFIFIHCSAEVFDQIEYRILTREIYSLCNIASGGFCNGVCIFY